MGISTVQQLIARAKTLNEYDNSGVANDSIWLDHFNSALSDMAEDLKLDATLSIDYIPGTTDYDLPEDFYSLIIVNDGRNSRVAKLRHVDQTYPPGWWVVNRGDKFVLKLQGYNSPETFTIHYTRYPKPLEVGISDQKPEVPRIAENALVLKAICHSLYNNNQHEKASYFEGLYRQELVKINTANARARG